MVRMLASAPSVHSPRGHLPHDPVGADAGSDGATRRSEHVPADRGVRVHRRPGGHGAHRAERERRMALRAQAGRSERVRRRPRSERRHVPPGPRRALRPRGAPLHPRDQHPGDHVAHEHRLAGRARRVDRRTVERRSPHPHVPPTPARQRLGARAGARAPMRQRPRRRADELRAGVRLRPATTRRGSTRARATARPWRAAARRIPSSA